MAEIKADEIASALKRQIEGFERGVEVSEEGTILSVGDGIARVYGLSNCMAIELLELPHGVFGMALNLEEDSVGVVLLGEFNRIMILSSRISVRTPRCGTSTCRRLPILSLKAACRAHAAPS